MPWLLIRRTSRINARSQRFSIQPYRTDLILFSSRLPLGRWRCSGSSLESWYVPSAHERSVHMVTRWRKRSYGPNMALPPLPNSIRRQEKKSVPIRLYAVFTETCWRVCSFMFESHDDLHADLLSRHVMGCADFGGSPSTRVRVAGTREKLLHLLTRPRDLHVITIL